MKKGKWYKVLVVRVDIILQARMTMAFLLYGDIYPIIKKYESR